MTSGYYRYQPLNVLFLTSSSTQESCSSWFIARLLYKEPIVKKLIQLATDISSEEVVENKGENKKEEDVIKVEYKLEDVAASAMRVLSRMLWTTCSGGKITLIMTLPKLYDHL